MEPASEKKRMGVIGAERDHPRNRNRDFGKGTTTFSRTPKNASVGEKGAVKGMDL